LMIREAKRLPPGREVKVAGLPIRPHRPPTKSGRTVAFFSVEDETGLIDVTVFEDVYHRYGHLLFGDAVGALLVCGRLEKRGALASITASAIEGLEGNGTRTLGLL
ncbi:MAG: OB-fold nucleic acid binding domain-containing protein, partial [Desulfofundulus sp.]